MEETLDEMNLGVNSGLWIPPLDPLADVTNTMTVNCEVWVLTVQVWVKLWTVLEKISPRIKKTFEHEIVFSEWLIITVYGE